MTGNSMSGRTGSLRLGHTLGTLNPTLHNGPGWRIGLWLQGCSLLCTKNCLSPHLLQARGGLVYPTEEVVAALSRVAARSAVPVEGITVLGGEPTDQMADLIELLAGVRGTGLSSMVYTGLTLASLRHRFGVIATDFLALVDLLVDGPFIDRLYDGNLIWRGSTNQRIHYLSGRYRREDVERAFGLQGKGFSISVTAAGALSISGLQSREGARSVEDALRASARVAPGEAPAVPPEPSSREHGE